jgi:uncharacterized protein (DUF736 family)
MQYDNEKRFVLFPKNNANPKAPNWSGTITIDGKEWEMSAWNKQGKNGGEFLSGSIKEPFKKGVDSHNKAKSNGYSQKDRANDGDEIPF